MCLTNEASSSREQAVIKAEPSPLGILNYMFVSLLSWGVSSLLHHHDIKALIMAPTRDLCKVCHL